MLDIGDAKIPMEPLELTNMYARLNVEELSEESLNELPPLTASKPASPPGADEYDVDQAQDVYELYLISYCCVSDMNRFCSFIREIWSSYRSGATTLEAAAITTTTALDLARGLDEEYQRYSATNAVDLVRKFYVTQCTLHGEDPDYCERPEDVANFRMYNVADASFLSVYMLLDAYSAVMKPGILPSYKSGFYDTYNPSSNRSKKSGREKWEEDRIILLEILLDFFVINRISYALPAEDEIIRALRPFMNNKLITFPVLMARQVFFDTHHVLREDIS